jgi:hypothetical protein
MGSSEPDLAAFNASMKKSEGTIASTGSCACNKGNPVLANNRIKEMYFISK